MDSRDLGQLAVCCRRSRDWQLRRFEGLVHECLPDVTRRLGMLYFDRYEDHTKLSLLTIGDAASQSSV